MSFRNRAMRAADGTVAEGNILFSDRAISGKEIGSQDG